MQQLWTLQAGWKLLEKEETESKTTAKTAFFISLACTPRYLLYLPEQSKPGTLKEE